MAWTELPDKCLIQKTDKISRTNTRKYGLYALTSGVQRAGRCSLAELPGLLQYEEAVNQQRRQQAHAGNETVLILLNQKISSCYAIYLV